MTYLFDHFHYQSSLINVNGRPLMKLIAQSIETHQTGLFLVLLFSQRFQSPLDKTGLQNLFQEFSSHYEPIATINTLNQTCDTGGYEIISSMLDKYAAEVPNIAKQWIPTMSVTTWTFVGLDDMS